MDSRKIVFHETAIILLGEVICTAVMFVVFALLGRFDLSVLLGGLVGILLSVANFFFMAVGASVAADRTENQDTKTGLSMIRGSYGFRMLILFALLFACAKSSYFNIFSLVLPLLFVRPTITIAEFFRKKGEQNP